MFHARSQGENFVLITPPDMVDRHYAEWQGLRADIITTRQRIPFDYRFHSDHHLLIAAEHSERDDGETLVEGLPKSRLRSITGKMTFVPAGHEFYGWQQPRVLMRASYFYIDPRGPVFDESRGFGGIELQPRLFFFDPELWQIAVKLREEASNGGARLSHYGDALGILLGHELLRLNNGRALPRVNRGGLTGWQQKRVADFIEEHLSDDVRLSEMAEAVDLSPFHFARAFKQSFGVPPHRYHVNRRIERAKALLAQPESSVTEVALAVGFAETSSFSAAFRKTTGSAPSSYRRGLG